MASLGQNELKDNQVYQWKYMLNHAMIVKKLENIWPWLVQGHSVFWFIKQ